jgi:hypothetical protein
MRISSHRDLRPYHAQRPSRTMIPGAPGGDAMHATSAPPRSRDREGGLTRRALALWPRLDEHALRRAQDDPMRVARLVAKRTSLPLDVILGMLLRRG